MAAPARALSAFASREAAGASCLSPAYFASIRARRFGTAPIKSSPAVSCGAFSARARRCASASPKLRPRSRSSESVSPSPAVETVRARSKAAGPETPVSAKRASPADSASVSRPRRRRMAQSALTPLSARGNSGAVHIGARAGYREVRVWPRDFSSS